MPGQDDREKSKRMCGEHRKLPIQTANVTKIFRHSRSVKDVRDVRRPISVGMLPVNSFLPVLYEERKFHKEKKWGKPCHE